MRVEDWKVITPFPCNPQRKVWLDFGPDVQILIQ